MNDLGDWEAGAGGGNLFGVHLMDNGAQNGQLEVRLFRRAKNKIETSEFLPVVLQFHLQNLIII